MLNEWRCALARVVQSSAGWQLASCALTTLNAAATNYLGEYSYRQYSSTIVLQCWTVHVYVDVY